MARARLTEEPIAKNCTNLEAVGTLGTTSGPANIPLMPGYPEGERVVPLAAQPTSRFKIGQMATHCTKAKYKLYYFVLFF